MNTLPSFPHAGFLSQLEAFGTAAGMCADSPLPEPLLRVLTAVGDADRPASSVAWLIALLKARAAVWQASLDTDAVADELRRYQKFVRPGPPSPPIVQLRQRQAAAQRSASRARQAFVAAAATFVRETAIEVPPRMALEAFVIGWIETHVPRAGVSATP